MLLAAALAPTDPVLATEVQVSEPVTDSEVEDDEARFALTSEAGLNDGLAFPFTYAAIAISLSGLAPGDWLGRWALVDLGWRLAVGVLAGVVVGWLLGRLFFSSVSERIGLTERSEGFVALAATFLAYGVAELAEGYGFVAVFVCACTIRQQEREHGYHGVLHKFVEQVERLLTVAVVVLLGGAVARGLLADVGWPEIGVALAVLLVIRPLTGWVGLTPGRTGPRERGVIAFFGVRGVGSLFYVAYAIEHGRLPRRRASLGGRRPGRRGLDPPARHRGDAGDGPPRPSPGAVRRQPGCLRRGDRLHPGLTPGASSTSRGMSSGSCRWPGLPSASWPGPSMRACSSTTATSTWCASAVPAAPS